MAANRPILRQPVLWAIVALALVAWLVGWLLYRDEVAEIRSERAAELAAVADLKVDQIGAWRHERLGDAEYVSSGPFNRALTERILAHPDDPDLREALTERAASLIRLYGYTAVIVATPDGQAFIGIRCSGLLRLLRRCTCGGSRSGGRSLSLRCSAGCGEAFGGECLSGLHRLYGCRGWLVSGGGDSHRLGPARCDVRVLPVLSG